MALIEDHHRTLAVSKLFKYNSDSLLCIFASAEGFFDSEFNNTINSFGDDAVALASFALCVAVPDGVGFGDVHVRLTRWWSHNLSYQYHVSGTVQTHKRMLLYIQTNSPHMLDSPNI